MSPLFNVTKDLSLSLYSGKLGSCTLDAPMVYDIFVWLSSPVSSLSLMPPETSMEVELKNTAKKKLSKDDKQNIIQGRYRQNRSNLITITFVDCFYMYLMIEDILL